VASSWVSGLTCSYIDYMPYLKLRRENIPIFQDIFSNGSSKSSIRSVYLVKVDIDLEKATDDELFGMRLLCYVAEEVYANSRDCTEYIATTKLVTRIGLITRNMFH
jgi:hypothetical protein